MHYDIFDIETEKLVNKAWTKHAYVEKIGEEYKVIGMPEQLLDIVKQYYQEVEII